MKGGSITDAIFGQGQNSPKGGKGKGKQPWGWGKGQKGGPWGNESGGVNAVEQDWSWTNTPTAFIGALDPEGFALPKKR